MNKANKNIIITTVSPYMPKKRYQFFYREDKNGECSYCGSLSEQEAGTKFILSENSIDEVIVIGPQECITDGEIIDHISLKKEFSLYKPDIDKLPSFDMFAYRLAQYLDNTDLELFEIAESFEESEDVNVQEFIKDLFNEIKSIYPQAEKSKLFHYLHLLDNKKETLSLSFENIIRRTKILSVIYQDLDSYYKMRPLSCNSDLTISFIPASFTNDSANLVRELLNRFDEIVSSQKYDKINIYLDTQGLNQADSLTVLYSFMMLANKNSIINIKTFITANPNHNYMIRKIYDSLSSIYMNYMNIGISDFVEYGKVDYIAQYWNETNDSNAYINSFVNAMKTIDIGISLCNFHELEKGIKKVRELINNIDLESEFTYSRGLFVLLIYGIIKDYGDLINNEKDVDVFEVIKWAYKKKYYQQAITFAESQIPNDIVKRGIWYYAKDKEDAQKVTKLLLELYKETAGSQRYAFDDISHYMVKIEGREKIEHAKDNYERQFLYAKYKIGLLDDNPNNAYKAYSVIENRDIISSALSAYYVLSTRRNLINHAERKFDINSQIEKEGECVIWDEIEKTLSYFIQKYQDAVDAVENKKFEQYIITHQEFSAATYANRKNYHKNTGIISNKTYKPCRYCIASPEGRKFNYNNLDEWITRFADKHPELMEEPVEVVVKKLIETRDKFMKDKTIITYKGYRLLPTIFDNQESIKKD